MAFDDLLKRAPGLVVMWILAIMLVGLIIIFYIMQTQHINKGGRSDIVRNLGNAMGGLGMVVCVIAALWIVFLVQVMRDARNIWSDASSLYVSRLNIFTNWWSTAVNSKTGNAISGRVNPNDDTQCFGTSINVEAGPETYDPYRTLIKAYHGGTTVPQTYESPVGPPGSTFTANETLETQQKLSFAYYRFIYCTKAYFQDIVNKNNLTQTNFPFLSSAVLANLQAGNSNCTAGSKIPDTVACLDGGTPGPGKCTANPCFDALNESIAAQCLLYDDHVYKVLNSGPLGVLASMGLSDASGQFATLGVPGLQVRSPA